MHTQFMINFIRKVCLLSLAPGSTRAGLVFLPSPSFIWMFFLFIRWISRIPRISDDVIKYLTRVNSSFTAITRLKLQQNTTHAKQWIWFLRYESLFLPSNDQCSNPRLVHRNFLPMFHVSFTIASVFGNWFFSLLPKASTKTWFCFSPVSSLKVLYIIFINFCLLVHQNRNSPPFHQAFGKRRRSDFFRISAVEESRLPWYQSEANLSKFSLKIVISTCIFIIFYYCIPIY